MVLKYRETNEAVFEMHFNLKTEQIVKKIQKKSIKINENVLQVRGIQEIYSGMLKSNYCGVTVYMRNQYNEVEKRNRSAVNYNLQLQF